MYELTPEYLRIRSRLWGAMGYDPHDAQMDIHNSGARFKVPCCGRRFGKSTSAVADLLPDYFVPNTTHWLVGPTYELGEREFEQLYNFIMEMPEVFNHKDTHISYSPTAGNMKIEFPWNTLVKVVSAEKPKSLLGKGLSSAIMCEAAQHEELTWTRYIRPALSDKRGRAVFPSTPRGFNWFYNYYRRGQDPNQIQWDSWQFPSWSNTRIYSGEDDEEFDEIRQNTSQMLFDQEYGAKFTAYEGRIYTEFDEAIHVQPLEDVVKRSMAYWRNFWAVDFGFSNPFVCLDIMVDPQDNVYVWREYYVRHKPVVVHARELRRRDNPPGWHLNGIFADPADPDGVATLNMYLGAAFARRVGVFQGIEAVKVLMKINEDTDRPRLFIDPSCTNLIRELNTLHMAENRKPGSTNNREEQHKFDDHAADALRYFASEMFVLGAGTHLADIYKYTEAEGDAETYFRYDQNGLDIVAPLTRRADTSDMEAYL